MPPVPTAVPPSSSGIGPTGNLRALGLPLVRDLLGAGENLIDHPLFGLNFASPAYASELSVPFAHTVLTCAALLAGSRTICRSCQPPSCRLFHSRRASREWLQRGEHDGSLGVTVVTTAVERGVNVCVGKVPAMSRTITGK